MRNLSICKFTEMILLRTTCLTMFDFNKSKRIEPLLFCIVTGLSLIPILSYKFFPTLDGPAHLYNATLVSNMLFDNNELLNKYFTFNSIPVPNWSEYIFLMFFKIFLPAYRAEKIILILYVVGYAFAFRHLILTLSPANVFLSYLVFPFIFSFLLFLGFYNFSLAVVFLLLSITFWIKFERTGFTKKRGIILFFLFNLTYFSHLFSFFWLLIFICLYMAMQFILNIIHKEDNYRNLIFACSKKILFFLIVSFIPIIFMLMYFHTNPAYQNKYYIDKVELIGWLKNIRPIIALHFQKEEAFTKKLIYLLGGLLSIVIYNKISSISFIGKTMKEKGVAFLKSFVNITDVWLIAAVLLLYLYFHLPDGDGAIGYVSVRLGYFFFIFLVLWISTQPLPKWLCIISAAVSLYCHFKLNNFYTKEEEKLNQVALECNNASEQISSNSVVLPLNFSDHWLHGHYSNYLGIDKPMVILENYESSLGWFPLKWNDKEIPITRFGNWNMRHISCLSWNRGIEEQSSVHNIDYVFILGDWETKTDSCAIEIKKNLNEHYQLFSSTENCKLYKLKK